MLRALFVTSSLAYGGAENHTIILMNRLAERGHECHAAYIKDDHSLLNRIRARSSSAVRCLAARRFLDSAAIADLAALIANLRPAAIVAANPYPLMYAAIARRLAGVRTRLVVTYHSTRLVGVKEQLQMLFYRPLFWAADCAIFVSDRQRRHWRRRALAAKHNVVIHNGVDTDEFLDTSTAEQRTAARRGFGFAASDFVIGAVGGLRREKNQVQLVDAVDRLRRAGLPARALLIGDGVTRAEIEALARERGLERDVVVTGFVRDVRPYVTACDVVAVCSVTEAMSLAALEAMALERPVVHSDVGSATEIIDEPGQSGLLFPVNDTDALVACLGRLVDPAVRLAVGARARAVVERRFSERMMVERYEKLLLELTSSGDRRRPSKRLAGTPRGTGPGLESGRGSP